MLYLNRKSDAQTRLDYAITSLVLARNTGVKFREAYALCSLVLCYHELAQSKKVLYFGVQALPLLLEIDDTNRYFKVLTYLAEAALELEQVDNALIFLEEYLRLAQEMEDTTKIAQGWKKLGWANFELNRAEVALSYLILAYKSFVTLGDKAVIAHTLTLMAQVYRSLNQVEAAYTCLEQACSYFLELDDKASIYIALLQLSEVAEAEQDYTKAVKHLFRALTLTYVLELPQERITILRRLGYCKRRSGHQRHALVYLNYGLFEAQSHPNRLEEGLLLVEMGFLRSAMRHTRIAIARHLEALAIFQELGDPVVIYKQLLIIADAYWTVKDYTQVRSYFRQANQLKALIEAGEVLQKLSVT